MDKYFDFFFGTPKRFLITIGVIVAIWGLCNLDQVERLFEDLYRVLIGPILRVIIFLVIVIAGLRILIAGVKKRR